MNLIGYCDRMPLIDAPPDSGGRTYVIVGEKASWSASSLPKTLAIEGQGTKDVSENELYYICRGWSLEDGDYSGSVTFEDGTVTSVSINISTIC